MPENKEQFKINTGFKKLGLKIKKSVSFISYVTGREGTTAIEFSLLFIPYLIVILGILELSIMYASASLLEGATNSAARLIRTGQLQQSGGDPEVMFRERLCDFASVLIDCGDVRLEVVRMDSFANYDSYGPTYDEEGNMISQGFDAGGSNDQILIRAAYRYRMLTPLVGRLLTGNTGERHFLSTIVLQTEPYEFEGGV